MPGFAKLAADVPWINIEELGWQRNTYTHTKQVGEYLVCINEDREIYCIGSRGKFYLRPWDHKIRNLALRRYLA